MFNKIRLFFNSPEDKNGILIAGDNSQNNNLKSEQNELKINNVIKQNNCNIKNKIKFFNIVIY